MKRYYVVYEGNIFDGDRDGLNVHYSESYTDISWLLNVCDRIVIIDTFSDIVISD